MPEIVKPRSVRAALHLISVPYTRQRTATQCLWHRTLTHSFNKCAWCVPQKSISGAVGATLGNAPYQLNSPAILVYFPASVAFCWSGARFVRPQIRLQ